tara:strand:+ start:450 stop:1253 length:804 start_codon:yes stop_codon:yes gene_type:complete
MDRLRFTILGCGSSGGVPRLGGNWGECDPRNPKNIRQRCSLLVERENRNGKTRVLIDTSPDMRNQLLDAGVGSLDGVLYTHSHADHVHGLDDLRMIYFNMRTRINVWADQSTQKDLVERFKYAFVQPADSPYPPILNLHTLEGVTVVEGEGGSVTFTPFRVKHGNINALGFRIGPLIYLPDVSEMSNDAWDEVAKAKCWVLDALRRNPHPSHSHLENSLKWIKKSGIEKAVLTNMHVDLDYETLMNETPKHVEPAFDGMVLDFGFSD